MTDSRKKRAETKKSLPKPQLAKKTTEPLKSPAKIASSWQITKNAWSVLWQNKTLFSGIMLIYGLAYLLLVQGLAGTGSAATIKSEFSGAFHGSVSGLVSGMLLIGSSNSGGNPSASTYQAFLILVISVVVIWTLRQVYSGAKVRIRDGYYKGLYPLIPFILILLFVAVELIPLVIGTSLYTLIITDGIGVNPFEKLLGVAILLSLVYASLYLISSSIFGLYIVTLEDMTPIKALRSAKQLVKGRRLLIVRKLIYLPVMLLIVVSLIMLPFILIVPAVSVWVFFILSLGVVLAVHSYLYNLYRELLK